MYLDLIPDMARRNQTINCGQRVLHGDIKPVCQVVFITALAQVNQAQHFGFVFGHGSLSKVEAGQGLSTC
jgi:hypothetical protein